MKTSYLAANLHTHARARAHAQFVIWNQSV